LEGFITGIRRALGQGIADDFAIEKVKDRREKELSSKQFEFCDVRNPFPVGLL